MRVIYSLAFWLILLSTTTGVVQASYFQQTIPDSAAVQTDDEEQSTIRRNRIVLLPIIFSSPDTRYAYGVLPQYLFYADHESRPSKIRMDAFYTQNKQFNVTLRPQIWLQANKYLIAGKISFRKWPTSFYGIGSNTHTDDKEKFSEQSLSLSAEVQRQIWPGIFVGLEYSLRHGNIKEVEAGRTLDQGLLTGSGKGIASGMGLIMSRDTRNDVNYPTNGSLHRFSATFYGPLFGSDYTLSSYAMDFRQYISLGGPHVVALQAETRAGVGDLPFRMMPGVGQPLRGYGSTRYIDANRIVFQAEYRVVPLWWRLGLTAFAGVGDVASSIRDFSFANPKWAVGLGIHFLVYPNEKITIRQDFAFGKNSSGDYLDLGTSF